MTKEDLNQKRDELATEHVEGPWRQAHNRFINGFDAAVGRAMNIETKIEEYIEREADNSVEKWFKDNGWVATEGKVIPSIAAFKAGADLLLPLLMYQHDQFTRCIKTLFSHEKITQPTAEMLIKTYERQLLQMLGGKVE